MAGDGALSDNKSEKALKTLDGDVTLDEALDSESNMLQRLTWLEKRRELLDLLLDNRSKIEASVSAHLGLERDESCSVDSIQYWIHGSFNLCLPVSVHTRCGEKRLMIRFPLPYRVGEEFCPGNAEEKLRCEVATYIWVQQQCPDVPIPKLFGFAFGSHRVSRIPRRE